MSNTILADTPFLYPRPGREYRGKLLEVYGTKPTQHRRNGYPMLRYVTSIEQIIEFKTGTGEWRTEGVAEPGREVKLPAWHPHLRNALLRAYKQTREDGVELLGRSFQARFDELSDAGARWTLTIDGITIPPAFEERRAPWEAWASEGQDSGSGFDKQAALERLQATGVRPASEEPNTIEERESAGGETD